MWVGYDTPRTIIANGYAAELAVPIWGRFMKTATRNDAPQWFKQPSGLSSATICRLSGALATDSCRHAIVYDGEGNATNGSLVYNEYFISGTEPRTFCPIHGVDEPSGWRALFSFGRDRPHAEVRDAVVERRSVEPRSVEPRSDERTVVADAVQPPGVTGGVLRQPEPQASPAEPKKRGFWGRIFGPRRDDAPRTNRTDR